MSKVSIYNSDYISVEYWAEKELIQHKIHKPISGELEMFKEALNAGTDALEKYKITKWLSDDRNNDALTPEGNEWSFNNWQPRTIKAGWKYWAAVVPQDLMAAGTLVPVIDELYKVGLRMMTFTDTEKALQWLDSLK